MISISLAVSLFLMQAAAEPDPASQEAVGSTDSSEEAAQPSPPAVSDPNIDVIEEKPEKITDRSHPDYVRCKGEAVIGSRARRKRTCMTNHEWDLVARRGNEFSRDFVNQNRDGFMDGQGGLGGGKNTGLGGLGGG